MKILLGLLLSLCFFVLCFSQNNSSSVSQLREEVRLDLTRPSAFIDFEKFDEKNNQIIWLRFYNNTKGKIHVATSGYDSETEEYGLFYDVKVLPRSKSKFSKNDIPFGRLRAHISSIKTVNSGESIRFSVPKEHLASGLYLVVDFSYEWELTGQGGGGGLEIIHRTSFFSWKLPKRKN